MRKNTGKKMQKKTVGKIEKKTVETVEEKTVETVETVVPEICFSNESRKSIRSALQSKSVDLDSIVIDMIVGDAAKVKADFNETIEGLHVSRRIKSIELDLDELKKQLHSPTLKSAVMLTISKASLMPKEQLEKNIKELTDAGEEGFREIIQTRHDLKSSQLPGYKALDGLTGSQILQGFGY